MNTLAKAGRRACAARGGQFGIVVLCAWLAVACASVQMQPAALTPAEGREAVLTIERDTELRFDTGYTRTLRAGTRIVLVGTLAQGKVYRFVDAVLTVEGTQMHEAWVVVDGEKLVGYYLPVEKAFVPQSSAPSLQIRR
jgi:hypothetical protein